MSVRADFYLGMGPAAIWLGSLGSRGNIEFMPTGLRHASGQHGFREAINLLLKTNVATRPDQGWPWAWDTSEATDYTYAWAKESVWVSYFGSPWFPCEDGLPEDPDCIAGPPPLFPDMSKRRQLVAHGPRSGLVSLSTL